MARMEDRINPYDGRLVCAADAHGNIVFSAPLIGQEPRRGLNDGRRKDNEARGSTSRALQVLQRHKERVADPVQHSQLSTDRDPEKTIYRE